jgi:hypothetical protein
VRDLFAGGWSKFCMSQSSGLHRHCKEIVRKLAQNNRLRPYPPHAGPAPVSAVDWCQESLRTSTADALDGIIASHNTKQKFDHSEVASIEKLTGTNWWQKRSPSTTLDRKTADYLRVMHRVLMQANSLMFIDPNLDPSSYNYREFPQLLEPLTKRAVKPRLEIHRSFCKGDGKSRTLPTKAEWKVSFAGLDAQLKTRGLEAEVFFWDDFHIRLLITDVVGINLEAGFDTTSRPDDKTIWTRLGRSDKDSWQKRFDPAANTPKWRFTIGV